MTRFSFRLLVSALLASSVALYAQDSVLDLSGGNARAHFAPAGGSLAGPTGGGMPAAVADFLQAKGHSAATAASLTTAAQGPVGSGNTLVRLTQQIGGQDVYGTYAKAVFGPGGELLSVVELLAPSGPVAPASINEAGALNAALRTLYPGRSNLRSLGRSGNTTEFANDGFFHENPSVTRVVAPLAGGALRSGFLVKTWSQGGNQLHHTLVSGSGQILLVESRTNNDSYRIFPDHPANSTQTVVNGPGGWLSGSQTTINIKGNNVNAYLDRDNNNSPDAGGSIVSDGNFVAAANLNQEPTTATNQAVAVQNLFYLNNVIHDKLYSHGFTEAAGNFQEDNFGKGGAGSDSVNAEAQDGGGTDNANFSTPADGSNPRMQMYLWTQTTPKRDGDLDSDIVWHEYGHGLTWRMIGNMSGPMSGAIGEGMSDVLAILINNNDVVGEYSYNRANGIRSGPYTNYPRTYGDFTGSSVHYDGEIYAAIIWRLWGLVQADGISKDTLFDYLVKGMNSTPSGPAIENMRDGILAASPTQAHDCLVWQAFSEFGVGVGAKASAKGGGPFGGGKVSVTESFAVPSECAGPQPVNITTTSLPNATQGVSYSAQLNATGGDGSYTWSVSGNPAWLSLNTAIGILGGTPPQVEGSFNFDVTATSTTGSDTQALTLTVAAPAAISLTALGRKVKGVQQVDLTWSGASSSNVDVKRDGATIATTANDGGYTDNIGVKGAGTYSYQVCAVGTSTCSAVVQVVF